MLPPGGGSNLISSRLTRHMLLITLDSFEDNTLNKIFITIMDWHFAKGFTEVLTRTSKVSLQCINIPHGSFVVNALTKDIYILPLATNGAEYERDMWNSSAVNHLKRSH